MTAKQPIIRPAYDWREAEHVADAANLIAAEANAEGCEVRRPFNEIMLVGRPSRTATQTLADWFYEEGRQRESHQRKRQKELEAENVRLHATVSKYIDAHDRALKATASACRAAYDGGYAAGLAAGRGAS